MTRLEKSPQSFVRLNFVPQDTHLAGFPGCQVQENAEVARNVMRLELVYEARKSEFNSN